MSRIRKNITVSPEIAEWYENEAERMGASQSSLMAMALQFYIDHRQALAMSGTMQKLIELVENQGELTAEQKEIMEELNHD